ncbi:MAG: hypothetical protein M3Y87_17970, partial [Myxococcota bacterium]|nr:hypothetical protein [Myxococcota bacterium]
MSLLARLAELRATRASAALVELQQAIDRAVLDTDSCSDDQLERLCILRELAVMQMETLAPRVRRNPTLRGAIEASCRAYRAWGEEDGGTDDEQRLADELAVRVLELRTVTGD